MKGDRARIAAIINLTSDSFYGESRNTTHGKIVSSVVRAVGEGADMLDIGACSTRPGSQPVSAEEEIERLEQGMPAVLEARNGTPLSVDTFRAGVAEKCLKDWKADVINDVSGGSSDMFSVVAEYGAGYVLTYNRSTDDDIVDDMMRFFDGRLTELGTFGIKKVILDPGFGFSKDMGQNYRVLAELGRLKSFGLPVMAGMSRKSMAYRPLDILPEDSLEATVALDTIALSNGAEWLRVHDVRAAFHTIGIFRLYKDTISI